MIGGSHLRRVATTLVVALVGLVAVACGSQSGSTATAADEGRRLYQQYCTDCHGQRGDRIPATPLSSKEFLGSRGDATLAAAIADGKGVMPAWGQAREGPLTDEQIRAVLAYVNSTAGRASPSLLAGAGKAVFEQQCTRCHGDHGDRVPVAPLAQKAFLDSRTDAQLFDAIDQGTGVMPGFRQSNRMLLSGDQVQAVVAYLRANVDAVVADRVRQGRDLYLRTCLVCHGERGDRTAGVNLASAEFLSKRGDAAIATAISEGKGAQMPGFGRGKGGTFGVDEVGAVLAYLKAWSGLPADTALAAPTLLATGSSSGGGADMAARGKELFARTCSACHGDKGDKVPSARLNDAGWLEQRGDDVLLQSITDGKGAMPAFGKDLKPDDVRAILAYVKSLAGVTAAAPPGPPASASASVAGAASSPGPIGPEDEALVAHGRELFTQTCSVCHGGTPDKMGRLADGVWLQQRGDAALTRSIIEGRSLPGSKDAMPAFGQEKNGPLGAADIKSVVWYLKSVAGVPFAAPAAPAASGASDVAQGKELFSKNCALCHGDKGDKLPPAPLNDPAWLRQRGESALSQSISTGKGAMPAFGKDKGGPLNPQDVIAIIDFLQSAGKR